MTAVEVVSLAERSARVVVPDFQLSLAIGKEGQNARLAARLTGWRIDIRSDEEPTGRHRDRRWSGGRPGLAQPERDRGLGCIGVVDDGAEVGAQRVRGPARDAGGARELHRGWRAAS